MPTNRLTDAAVKSLKPSKRPQKVSDGGGLHLQLQPGGGRLWRLAYRHAGKQKTLALGAYPTVTLGQARDARDAAKKLIAAGTDPAADRKAKKGAPSQIADRTFGAIATRWFEARKAGWSVGYANRVWSRVDDDLIGPLGAMDIEVVGSSDVLNALRRIEARSAIEMAHRVKQYASDIFRFAKAEKLVTANPVEDVAHALATPPPTKHRASLKSREVPDFLRALRDYDGEPRTRQALRLALLTFVRTSEIRFAKWEEFEALNGVEPLWRVPAIRMKMRVEHLVPLSRQAVAALREIRSLATASEMLFSAAPNSGVSIEKSNRTPEHQRPAQPA